MIHATTFDRIRIEMPDSSAFTATGADLVEAAVECIRLRAACEAALGVLTEPGVMDVDEWKAWRRTTEHQLRAALEHTPAGAPSCK